jgi:hypothetical protein
MPESIKCRHGKPHYENCEACGAEYRYLEKYRANQRAADSALVAKARELGRSYTAVADDGCEVTATPEGHIFYNVADWF